MDMAVPPGHRFAVEFDEMYPQGLFLVGELRPVTEYQSQEDRARNKPVRSQVDELTGLPLFTGQFVASLVEKDRDESITWVVRATGMRAVDAPVARSTKVTGDAKAA
jgi:hypothetical protein